MTPTPADLHTRVARYIAGQCAAGRLDVWCEHLMLPVEASRIEEMLRAMFPTEQALRESFVAAERGAEVLYGKANDDERMFPPWVLLDS